MTRELIEKRRQAATRQRLLRGMLRQRRKDFLLGLAVLREIQQKYGNVTRKVERE